MQTIAKENYLWYGKGVMKTKLLTFFAALLMITLLTGCITREAAKVSDVYFLFPSPTPEPTEDPHANDVLVPDGAGGFMWTRRADNLTPFPYDRHDFTVDRQRVVYSGDSSLGFRLGIDVSDHQRTIDWQAVAADGVEFAIIRCAYRGYSAGALQGDSRFYENIEGALAAGLDVGVYIFSQAVTVEEAAEEARFVLDALEGYDLTLPVFYDWEDITDAAARTDNMDGNTLTACALEFCRVIEEGGYESGVYVYMNLAYFTYDLDQFQGVTLWFAQPGSRPEFYYDHDYWQYSFTGAVSGIEGDVDLNVMYVRGDR